jgi:putative tryptophan/tyrosine transport system substrate-binding protein
MLSRVLALSLTLGILTVPLVAGAQPAGKIPRIGFLGPGSIADWSDAREALRQGLDALGYIEGQNIGIEWRFTTSGYDGLPDLAAQFVQLNPDVIVTVTTPPAKAAKAATTTIPIVMSGVARPVEQGLVASMSRPGGTVTGTTNHPFQKQLQLLKEAAPRVSRVAVLTVGGEPESSFVRAMHDAGQALGVTTVPVTVASPTQFDVAALAKTRPDALYVFSNSVNGAHAKAILDFAATNRLPTMNGDSWWVRSGGFLVSYSVDWLAMRRRATAFVVKLLNGTKPADIPSKIQLSSASSSTSRPPRPLA